MGEMEEEFIESILNSEPLGVVCDKCGSDRITEISYGLPWWLIVGEPVDPGISALVKEKRIVLGGCMHGKDSPKYFCRDCSNKFGKEDTVKKIEEFTLIGQDAWHYTHIYTTIEEDVNGKLSLLVWDMDESHRIDLTDPNAFIDQVLQTGIESIDNNAYDFSGEDTGEWAVHIRYDDKDICIRGMAYIPDEVCRLRALLGIRYSYQSPKRGAYHKMEESERIEWIQSVRRIDRWRRNELIKDRWQEKYLVCETGVAGRMRLGVKEGCRGSDKTSMATIKAKLGFDPLTYKIKNEDHSTGDGAYNPFSVLTNEELDYVMGTIRNQNKGKNLSEGG